MPIYEYQCAGCNHQFDVIQKMNDEPIKTCPKCAEDKAIRLVSAAGFQLKGSGWYATDFKTKPKPELSTDRTYTDDKSNTSTTTTTTTDTSVTPTTATTGSDSK